jgi:hypothetical protein
VASSSLDRLVLLWDVRTGRRRGAPLEGPFRFLQPVRRVAFSRDGSLLASCADDGTVRLWVVRARGWRAAPPPSHRNAAVGWPSVRRAGARLRRPGRHDPPLGLAHGSPAGPLLCGDTRGRSAGWRSVPTDGCWPRREATTPSGYGGSGRTAEPPRGCRAHDQLRQPSRRRRPGHASLVGTDSHKGRYRSTPAERAQRHRPDPRDAERVPHGYYNRGAMSSSLRPACPQPRALHS